MPETERRLERGQDSSEIEGVAEALGGESGGADSGGPKSPSAAVAVMAAQIAGLPPEALWSLQAMWEALRGR